MFRDFTCCVGTGMENHALLGDGIYYESGGKLWVNLYAPSIAQWKTEDATLEMKTDFPEGDLATLQLALKAGKHFTLALRRPAWAGGGFTVAINGKTVRGLPSHGSYVELSRVWKNGDTVALLLPKKLHEEPLPDNPRRVALMWGPLVLAGDLGPEEKRDGYKNRSDGEEAVPVFVAAEQPLADWLKPVPGKPGTFRTERVGRPHEMTFVPFYQLPERAYGIYWDLFTPQEWEKKGSRLMSSTLQSPRLQWEPEPSNPPGRFR
jgi:hypothetical protein